MKNFLYGLCVFVPLPSGASPIADTNHSPFFAGNITEDSVSDFIAKNDKSNDLTEIRIASPGGDVRAALRLGRWIRDKGINVRVRSTCYSACANYIFIAGKKKFIEPAAFVIWHGDVEQKDFRELVQKYENVKTKALTTKLNKDESLFLADYKIQYASLKDLRQQQDEFYRSLGIKSEVGRIGQEPVNFPSDGWTLTVKAMNYFGISNVEVPRGYGSEKYFTQNPVISLINHGPVLILDLDDSGKIIPVNLKQLKDAKAE